MPLDPDTVTVSWSAVRWGLGAIGTAGVSLLSLVVIAVRMSSKLDTVADSLPPLRAKVEAHAAEIPELKSACTDHERRIGALHSEKNGHARRLLAHGTTLRLVAQKVGVEPIDPESI